MVIAKIRRRAYKKIRNIVVNQIAASIFMPQAVRRLVLGRFGVRSQTSNISPRCFFSGTNIRIGKGTFINFGCYFENFKDTGIEIGDNCDLGMEVMLCTSTHDPGDSTRRAGTPIGKEQERLFFQVLQSEMVA